MAVSAYAVCPCGSGKLFNRCCQPYYGYVERAHHQVEHKQPAAAEQSVSQLVSKFPKVAQAWAYQAQILFLNGKTEVAEAALQKAFEIDPNLAFGYFLQGSMRLEEGELVGALTLFRKAVDVLDPNAQDFDSMVHTRIAELELQSNRPVAARAAMARSLHLSPRTDELRRAFDSLFGSESRLPPIAHQPYEFRPAPSGRADTWKAAVDSVNNGKLTAARKTFEQLAEADSKDPAAWFNVGLVRALLGDNPRAIEALSRSLDLEANEAALEQAGALVEVLRLGAGMEDEADYLEHRALMQLRESEPVSKAINDWGNSGRLLVVNANQEEGNFSALILEEVQDLGVADALPLTRIQSYLAVQGDILRFWHSSRAMLDKTMDEFRSKVGAGASEPQFEIGPAHYGDVVAEIMLFPTREGVDPSLVNAKMRDRARDFFEENWLRRPLKSLRGVTPLDAAAHPGSRKRLFGLVKFLEQCVGRAPTQADGQPDQPMYEFDRLRRKLGLTVGISSGAKIDFDLLSTADLGGLKAVDLTDEQIAQAFQAARRLDAPDLAAGFAKVASARTSIADRYPYFLQLSIVARDDGDWNEVLRLLAAAEEADNATNNGHRQNNLALVRAQTLARSGDVAGAYSAFKDAMTRAPKDMRFYAPAAEAMLGKKEASKALEFAEMGLKEARSQNNRDAEQQMLELVEAAKKQVS
jgi:tetratricopeptide (TPR) repeat protein